ncbi:hypothetical protein IJ095_00170 [Candidatus Saccharibacteria bacterium]|nr:hypothetical protein [Candidatus Saccharibacteria bacterium]
MLKSTKIILGLGILLGGSVAVLPSRSFAAVTIVDATARVSATVSGVVGFSATDHAFETGTTYGLNYDSTNNVYSGTFNVMDSTENFGTTTYEVLCNYRSATYSSNIYYDSDDNGTYDTVWEDDGTPVSPANADCSAGWYVTADSTYDNGNGVAVMQQTLPQYYISSTTPAGGTMASDTANWAMKVAGVSKTVSGSTYAPAYASGYNTFHAVPASAATVVSGNTFRTVSSVANTYIGTESFAVTYGFNAGMAVAGTYTGEVVYTLYIGS